MKKITKLGEFEELTEKIKECLEWYEQKRKNEIIFNLTLANGERLNIFFEQNKIAHLLGIDTEYLKSTGMFKGSSYQILEYIIKNPYSVYRLVSEGHLTFSSFISDYADEKVDSFKNICGVDFSNIAFVCKYDKENSFTTGFMKLDGDYYIAYNNNNKLFIVGLKKDGRNYYPITNRVVDLEDDRRKKFLYQLLERQIITMPIYCSLYFLKTDQQSRKLYIQSEQRCKNIRILNRYGNTYGSVIDVSTDYYHVCDRLNSFLDTKTFDRPYYVEIFTSISRKEIIDISTLQEKYGDLPEDIIPLIKAHNASLTPKNRSYTRELENKNARLEELHQKQLEELASLREECLKVKEENERLTKENTEYTDKLSSIKKILER